MTLFALILIFIITFIVFFIPKQSVNDFFKKIFKKKAGNTIKAKNINNSTINQSSSCSIPNRINNSYINHLTDLIGEEIKYDYDILNKNYILYIKGIAPIYIPDSVLMQTDKPTMITVIEKSILNGRKKNNV